MFLSPRFICMPYARHSMGTGWDQRTSSFCAAFNQAIHEQYFSRHSFPVNTECGSYDT